ncbi:hypothetical protein [Candidatus Avelusimicrobium alvi]|uniref:hypothetical protein n=1 Tax=Candidatus Avelusimicrobium alvi TaxID=3416221 RepID=UPI003D0E4C41
MFIREKLKAAFKWLLWQYPSLLNTALMAGVFYTYLTDIIDPFWPYYWNLPTYIEVALDGVRSIYLLGFAVHTVGKPRPWRGFSSALLQLILLGIPLRLMDEYYHISVLGRMGPGVRTQAINSILPAAACIIALYKIHTGKRFAVWEIILYILTLWIGLIYLPF